MLSDALGVSIRTPGGFVNVSVTLKAILTLLGNRTLDPLYNSRAMRLLDQRDRMIPSNDQHEK